MVPETGATDPTSGFFGGGSVRRNADEASSYSKGSRTAADAERGWTSTRLASRHWDG